MFNSIRNWIKPPVYPGDEDKTRVAALLNSILWFFITAAILYGIFAPIQPEMTSRRALIIFPVVIMLLVIKQLVNWGNIRFTGNLIVFVLWLTFTGAMLFGADYHNPAFMGYLVVVICAGLLLSWRAAIGWSLVSILTNAIILRLGQSGVLPPSDPNTPQFAFWTAQSLYILACTFMLSQTLRKIDEARARAQRELDERKRIEAEREKIIRELESKNAELERFTYTVSHDLKSPLITIGGFIGLLEEDSRSGDWSRFEKDLLRIREAKDKMHSLLNELLELSRVGRIMNPPVVISLGEIVEDALALTRGRLMMGNIQVVVAPNLPAVRGDRPRLLEVLQNLIDNAAKFMGNQPNPRIEIGTRQEGQQMVFFVHDNGVGIDPAFHKKIFGLFDKLDPRSEGTGVGLALVKRIIEVHGGRIWVESEGKELGTTVCFTLPVEDHPASAVELHS
jgi:signal transduction histidine kinase